MNLQQLLVQLNIEAEYRGDQTFDVLGKIGTKSPLKLCTFLTDKKFLSSMSDDVQLVLTTEEISHEIKGRNFCIVEDPKMTFFTLHNFLSTNPEYIRPKKETVIGANCRISILSSIAENNVVIGDNVTIEEFVTIKENTVIGDNVAIRSGSVIGATGFEQKKNADHVISIKHLGGLVINENVEIQHNSCIQKAIYPWDDTVIGNGCRIASLIVIGHATKIGNRTFIVDHSFLGGNVRVGDDVWIGAGAVVANAIQISDNARVNIGAVVTKDVADGESVSGNFAIEHSKFLNFIKDISR